MQLDWRLFHSERAATIAPPWIHAPMPLFISMLRLQAPARCPSDRRATSVAAPRLPVRSKTSPKSHYIRSPILFSHSSNIVISICRKDRFRMNIWGEYIALSLEGGYIEGQDLVGKKPP